MKTLFLKPAPGLLIRMPDNPAKRLPAEGAQVPASQFWLRRLAEGSAQLAHIQQED